MGGSIALTIRFSAEKTYRGSCWTNTLPLGLWAPAFYIDLDSSRKHAEQWLDKLLVNRAQDPELEKLWGDHNMLAPLVYGIVIVDYVTSTLISAQGYSSPNWLVNWFAPTTTGQIPTARDLENSGLSEEVQKWKALDEAGLLTRPGPWPTHVRESAYIKMPFKDVRCSDVDKCDAALQAWCETNFGLSEEERAAWAAWLVEFEE